jgi:hypothetical protein
LNTCVTTTATSAAVVASRYSVEFDRRARSCVHRDDRALGGHPLRRELEQHLGRALAVEHEPLGRLADDRGAPSIAVERQLVRALRGVRRAQAEARVEALSGDEQLAHLDAVLRERPGLVRADHRAASEGLDRGPVAHQGVARGHAPRAHRERERHRRQQPLGHVCDEDPDAKQEPLPKRQVHPRGGEKEQGSQGRGEDGDRAAHPLLDHPGVGRDAVACFEQDHVAGHERLCGDELDLPVAHDPSARATAPRALGSPALRGALAKTRRAR